MSDTVVSQYEIMEDGSALALSGGVIVTPPPPEPGGDGGIPLLSVFWSTIGLSEEGCLDLSIDNGLLPRTVFPDAWAKLERAITADTGAVVSEANWQAELLLNSGVCGKFSTGDGSTTFRVPLLRKRASFGFPDVSAGATHGDFLPDQMRPITGTIGINDGYGLGYASSTTNGTGAFSKILPNENARAIGSASTTLRPVNIDSAMLGPRYSGAITHGPLLIYTPMIKMYGSIDDPAVLNAAATVQMITNKLDTAVYEANRAADKWTRIIAAGAFTTGTPSVIQDSHNIASVTRVSTGYYQVTFLAPTQGAGYIVQATPTGTVTGTCMVLIYNRTTNGFVAYASNYTGSARDSDIAFVVFPAPSWT